MSEISGVTFSKIPEALTKTTRPWRALEGSAKPPTVSRLIKWLAKEYIAKQASYWQYSNKQLFERGIKASTKKPFVKQRKEACELLASFSVEAVAKQLAGMSLETLAFAERMVWHISSDESIAPAIAEARGLSDALRVVMRASKLGTEMSGGYTNAVYIVGSEAGRTTRGEPKPLRHLLCAAPKKDYDDAKRCAEDFRKKGADGGDGILLAYLFPDEDWGTRALIEELDARKKAPTTNQYRDDNHAWTLLSATRDANTVRRWVAEVGAYHVSTYAIELACVLSPKDSVPIFADAIAKMLVKPKYGPLHKTPPRETAHALGCIDSKEAAAALAPYATNTILGPQVLAWFHDHPKHGSALLHLAKGRGKKLEATTARVLGHGAVAAGDLKPIASKKEIPAILHEMPWRAKKGANGAKKSERIVVEDKKIVMLGLGLEKVKLVRPVKRRLADDPLNTVRDMNKAELAAWKKEAAQKKKWVCCDLDRKPRQTASGKWEFLRVPDREGLARWNERAEATMVDGELAWVERHGMKALPGFSHRDWIKWLAWDGNEEMFEAVQSMISPRVAASIARVASRRKHHRRVANAWLVENAEVAAYGLVLDALSGSRSEERSDAEAALLLLKSHGHDAVVRKVAKKYGKEVERGIAVLLDRDPLAIEITTVPKRPSFLRVDELPQVLLRGGKKAIDGDARAAIVEMLQITSIDSPYPGLEIVRKACDEASLGALALELVEQWVIGDAPGRHEWMLFAMLHFPSEHATRRVSELAREWARKNQAKALRACMALCEDGSDLALMHLAHIAETTRFAALKTDAGDLVKQSARARGLTEDELGDRTVPDAGLGVDGTIALSYGNGPGAREFIVSVSPSLEPVVREKTKKPAGGLGAPEKTIPRPSKTDDKEMAKQARERFDALKKDLAAIAQRQVRRLERAMALGRAWSVTELEQRIASHPLLRTIARSLVWEIVVGGNGGKCFRIAEDGSYADAKDNAVKVPANKKAMVRIAHPAATDLKAWSTIFGDYEIVQPFEQLGRVVTLPTATEKKSKELARAAAIDAPARKMLGTMESRGWRRNDAGFVTAWLRSLGPASELEARWPIKPGISMESLAMGGGGGGGASRDIVTTENLIVTDASGKSVPLGAIDAALFSEIVRDIEAVRNLE